MNFSKADVMKSMENILEVRVANEIFGFNADLVEQILRVPPITPVPLSDKSVMGVAVISGKIVNALDLGLALGDKSIDVEQENSRLLTLSNSNSSEAFVVDEVLNMIEVEEKNFEATDDDKYFLEGFYKTKEHIVQVLHVEKLVEDIQLEQFSLKMLDVLSENTEEEIKVSTDINNTKALFFRSNDEKFAIDIGCLRELIFVPQTITPITGSDALGMITLRDKVITLLDMNSLLGFESKEADERSRALVAIYKGKTVAFLVDEVEEVKTLDSNNLEPMQSSIANELVDYIYKDTSEISSIISTEFIRKLTKEYYIESEDDVAKNEETSTEEDMSEIAVFKISDEEYAFDIEEVQEIIRYEEITPVPEAPAFVEGILNLRGSVISIISLPKRLGFQDSINEKTKIVVCLVVGEKIGFIVDDVNEILFVEDRFVSKSKSEESIFDEIINLDDGKRVILKIKSENLIDEETLEKIRVIGK